MPYADNNGVKIYYEVEGQGPPLVLAHGGLAELSVWRIRGYTEALKKDFQLVLFDARGHGRSDKPHDPSSYGAKMEYDVLTVLDDIGIDQAHYLGYSMGARIGFRLAVNHAGRFRSFILGGASPYRREVEIKADMGVIGLCKALVADPQAAVTAMKQIPGFSFTPEDERIFLSADAEAMIAFLMSEDLRPGLTDKDLSCIHVPCLVYCGELDAYYPGARDGASNMPQAKFLSLPDLDHILALLRSDLVLPHVKEFLAGVSKTQSLK
jgi:pimeloyl-ACP methyl ester carboxylesterase